MFTPRTAASLTLTLAVSLACSPSTSGLGDAADDAGTSTAEGDSESTTEGESEGDEATTTGDTSTDMDSSETESEDGPTGDTTTTTGEESMDDSTGDESTEDESTEDESTEDESTEDTGPAMCTNHDYQVTIELDGVQGCADLNISGWLETAANDQIQFTDCSCNERNCIEGQLRTLDLDLPDSGWLATALPKDTCLEFRLYSEDVSPQNCRYSRLDVKEPGMGEKPLYSVGSGGEHWNHNGFEVKQKSGDECVDDCGTWELHDVEFGVMMSKVTVPAGTEGFLDAGMTDFEVVAWPSWTFTPGECDLEVPDQVISWAAIQVN